MISVHVRMTEAEAAAVSAGDPALRDRDRPATQQAASRNAPPPSAAKHRPVSCVLDRDRAQDRGLSGLNLQGMKMATKGQHHSTSTRPRGGSMASKWSAERSYTVDEGSTRTDNFVQSGHLRPSFPEVGIEQSSRVPSKKLVRKIKRDTWTGDMIKKQSKVEKEYKGLRIFTRRKSTDNSANDATDYKPPSGYTSFVMGKPLYQATRQPSGKERAHLRFMEKLEMQNKWLDELSDSDDEDRRLKRSFLRIPSATVVDSDSSPRRSTDNKTSLQIAMDGIRIANDIERSVYTGPRTSPDLDENDKTVEILDQTKETKNLNEPTDTTSDIEPSKQNGNTANSGETRNRRTESRSALITTGSSSTKPVNQFMMNTSRKSSKKTVYPTGRDNSGVQEKQKHVSWTSQDHTSRQQVSDNIWAKE